MRALVRYAIGLPRYLREPLGADQCRRRLARQLASRDRCLLSVLERGVYANPRSPYRRLLEHAGIELEDVGRLVRDRGVEGSLECLYDAGIRVTLDELRGRRPICRPGLELSVTERDFDNPLLSHAYEARTSGSRSPGTRIGIDLDLLAHEAGYQQLFLSAFGLEGRPYGIWRPVPPGQAGMKSLLRRAKLGASTERWFAHNRHSLRPAGLKYAAFTSHALLASRASGRPLPRPEHVPLEQAAQVTRWLAAKVAARAPALLETTWSSAVRVCRAAHQEGLDIADTFFRLGGESATEARARMVTETGSRLACHYSMGEVGHIGIACAAPAALNEVHLLTDKLALIERDSGAGAGGIASLHLTTLLPSCPKLMVNVDTGDYGTLTRRRCGCAVERAGFETHLHGIASYEKLTSGGMNLLASDLVGLLDDVLPSGFGGAPTDYQLVEEDDDALPRVSVVVNPSVGEIDEAALIAAVLGRLAAAGEPQRMMAEQWRSGGTVRVVRRAPYAVGAKVLPLHILGRRPS